MESTDTRWVITGAGGMLATDLLDALRARGAAVSALSRAELDITDADAARTAIAPESVVVNCAAYTAVDAAEDDREAAEQANAVGPGVLARACAERGARLVHISTDYVFDGAATTPYPEDAPLAPQGVYGATKAAGEEAVRASGADALIVRTAWLYGAHGRCFPKTIARAGRERGALTVVSDQIGQPTWTRDVAGFVIALIEAKAPAGTYHGTSSGQASWFEFAREVCASAGLGDIVAPVSSSEYPQRAPRPAWSVLGHAANEAVGVPSIGHWLERWRLAAPEVLA
ncbi:MAG: dTDP-4-dehydrorhamnose reductase [Actinomycetes bacterium]|nr:MAG: dTDP-4-dehydrorhamnose reductase [Actinomycetota bacterium]